MTWILIIDIEIFYQPLEASKNKMLDYATSM